MPEADRAEPRDPAPPAIVSPTTSPAWQHVHRLLVATAAGDETAFGALYDAVASPIYALVRGVLPNTARADQVMVAAMTEVWSKAPTFDAGRGSASAWVCTIAYRHTMLHVPTRRPPGR